MLGLYRERHQRGTGCFPGSQGKTQGLDLAKTPNRKSYFSKKSIVCTSVDVQAIKLVKYNIQHKETIT